jgi:hypothetical protein
MPADDNLSDAPRIGEPPRGDIRRPQSFVVQGRRDLESTMGKSPTADVLRSALARMSGIGPTAEAAYQEGLRAVQSRPTEEVKALIAEALRSLPEEAYLDRWALVQLSTDLRQSELIDLLDDTISTPIPAERSSDADYKSSTVAQESLIRISAVEGLVRLAAEGSTEAVNALLRHVSHEHRTIKEACVLGLKDLDKSVQTRLRAAVSEEDQDLLELHRAEVRDIPQPVVDEFVKNRGAHEERQLPTPH